MQAPYKPIHVNRGDRVIFNWSNPQIPHGIYRLPPGVLVHLNACMNLQAASSAVIYHVTARALT